MKKLIYTLLFVLISVAANGQQAKYVFYFIGDGMGVNQVNGTEMYQAELQNGRIGVEPLLFTQFPVATMATTFSATNSVTDSAAAGTALATGKKTYNSAISVGEDKNPIETVAEKAKKAGKKVGVTTSVSVDHATPAAFYAHQADRNMNYEIAVDLTKANFDFYAGGGFLKPDKTYDKKDAPNIFPIFEEAGYTVARGYSDYKAKSKDAGKMIDQSVVAPYPEVSVFVTRNGIDDRIVEATEQRRQAVVPFVQLVDTFRIVEIGIVFVIGDGQKSADDVLSLLFGGNPESAFVQVVLIDVVAEQQHVVGAVLI